MVLFFGDNVCFAEENDVFSFFSALALPLTVLHTDDLTCIKFVCHYTDFLGVERQEVFLAGTPVLVLVLQLLYDYSYV